MAKKTSIGAHRRTAARAKAQQSTPKKVPASPAARRLVRHATRAPASDPVLSATPAAFEADGYKFVLTPPALPRHEVPAYEYLGELPDSYGSRRLYLVARDPHFLFAYWDFSEEQFVEMAQRAGDGNVYLQLHLANGDKLQQIQITSRTKHWYLHANHPGADFYAELGFYHADGRFEPAARSGRINAPRDNPSPRTQARFVTLPFHIPFKELLDLIRAQMRPGEELAEALARLQEEGYVLPFDVSRIPSGITGNAVYDYLGEEVVRRLRVGSFDITEVLRRRFEEANGTSSGQWTGSSPSSPFGASFGKARDFFLHVNAELIIYGGTDPDAQVRINGQDIALKPDGSFSFHFNLPDGQFHIPVEATAPDAVETRSALLSFLRMSDYAGEVTATPQPPRPEPFGRSR